MIKINAQDDLHTLLANLHANRMTRQAFYLSAADVAVLLQRFLRRDIDAAVLTNLVDLLHGNDLVQYESGKASTISRTLQYVSSAGSPPSTDTLAVFIDELTARN